MGLSTVSVFKNVNNNNPELKHLTNEQLKKLQKTLAEMMDDIDEICRKYNLKYHLTGGSCLGAVRHNGFIPWDDDMDLDMPRKDFEKFCEVFKKEKGDKYFISNPSKTRNTGIAFGRIRKKGTIYKSREDKNVKECGIYVDVFIIENTYNFVLMRYIHGLLSMFAGFILSCRNFYANRKEYLNLVKNDRKNKLVFRAKIFAGFLIAWLSQDKLIKFWNKINGMCHSEKSKYVTVPVGRNHFFGEMYQRKDFCEMVEHEFEGRKFYICKEYDQYLRHMYGDYMTIPPKEKWETHVFYELSFGKEEK